MSIPLIFPSNRNSILSLSSYSYSTCLLPSGSLPPSPLPPSPPFNPSHQYHGGVCPSLLSSSSYHHYSTSSSIIIILFMSSSSSFVFSLLSLWIHSCSRWSILSMSMQTSSLSGELPLPLLPHSSPSITPECPIQIRSLLLSIYTSFDMPSSSFPSTVITVGGRGKFVHPLSPFLPPLPLSTYKDWIMPKSR